MLQIILCSLSVAGYYLITKKPIAAYIVFIIQNIIAFIFLHQWYMLINVIFCIIFFIATLKYKGGKDMVVDADNYQTYLQEEFPADVKKK